MIERIPIIVNDEVIIDRISRKNTIILSLSSDEISVQIPCDLFSHIQYIKRYDRTKRIHLHFKKGEGTVQVEELLSGLASQTERLAIDSPEIENVILLLCQQVDFENVSPENIETIITFFNQISYSNSRKNE